MPRRASATSFGADRGNARGDQIIAGQAAAEIHRIRQRFRRTLDKRFSVLERIADGHEDAKPQDRLKALDILAKYGVGTQQAVDVTSGGERLVLSAEERVARLAALAEALRAR